MLLIGSIALNKIDYTRQVNDVDIVCFKKQIPLLASLFNFKDQVRDEKHWKSFTTKDGRLVECLLADNSKSLKKILNILEAKGNSIKYCSGIYLYVIKAAHIHFNTSVKKWLKHIKDYLYLQKFYDNLNNFPASQQEIKDLIKLQHKFMIEVKGEIKTPKLNNVNKTSFFNDKVVKFFEHDDIHQVMAHNKLPAYTLMQKDTTVTCYKNLWEKMSYINKINCVLEEAYVIALERRIIPGVFGNSFVENPKDAVQWALMRISTTLCSGWFREFAINNMNYILNNINLNYVNIFFEAFEKEEIKFDEKYEKNVSRVFNSTKEIQAGIK